MKNAKEFKNMRNIFFFGTVSEFREWLAFELLRSSDKEKIKKIIETITKRKRSSRARERLPKMG